MPGDQSGQDTDGGPALSGAEADDIREFLVTELRGATSAAISAGADPDAVTADLEERLHRVRRMLAEAGEEPPGDAGRS